MRVLGFRGDPNAPRYAVVSCNTGNFVLENASGDSKLTIPARIPNEAEAERVQWIFREIGRIFDVHSSIDKVIIKCNEFTKVDSMAKRRSAYIDAAVLLACAHHDIPVEIKIYASMGTSSAETQNHAEKQVGKTDKYWDKKMADAVNAALWGLRHQ